MTATIIITLCALLLIAYLFDVSSSKTRIPSVILLLILGWGVRQLVSLLKISFPDFSAILPVLGTIGLILIVLEGSLELELNRSKAGLIKKSFFGALLSMLGFAFLFAWLFQYFGHFSFKNSLINAIPLSVISSAIAIPSVKRLGAFDKEFVTYESSFSDILGVLFFNFIVLNEVFSLYVFGHFGLQILIIIVVSFIVTIGLSYLLYRIKHHVKFVPIIILVVLIYAVSKVYHLPGLIFILIFGLVIGNLDELKNFKWIQKFHPEVLNSEVRKFKELTIEATFLVRSLFFLLFGFLLETAEILNTETMIWALAIVMAIFVLRAIQLKLSSLPLKPLLFIAPRGLITILLFLSIGTGNNILLVNKSLVIQVIILTALILMVGLITNKSSELKIVKNM
ncbi:MAG: sodium:proton antiporter [Chitinophagaceae bacterium]|nr:sodium:proton antiporter [Chitinophagaceae bacterium]